MSQFLHKSRAMSEANLTQFMFRNEPIDEICTVLNQGGTILYPTDTIWGVGCDATNPAAIEKIYELKKRDPEKPLVLLVSSIEMLKLYIDHLHPRIETLFLHHKRPLTVVFEHAKNLPDNLLPPDGSIAIRIAQDTFCKNLISQFGKPIVSTSANLSGQPYPAHFGAISSAIIQGVDFVVKKNQKEEEAAQPSVIIKVDGEGEIVFLRE